MWIVVVGLVTSAFTSASLPAIEYLTVSRMAMSNSDHITCFPRLLQLKEVTLIDHSEASLFHDDDFAMAERLTFIAPSGWMDYDINCIRRFRNIRTLILGEKFHEDPYFKTLDSPVEPAALPLLETLTLYGLVPHYVLGLITTPRLRTMEVEAKGRDPLVAIHLVHLVRSLECLYVSLSEGAHVPSLIEELERLVAGAPALVSVCVSSWMVQHMKEMELRAGLCVTGTN